MIIFRHFFLSIIFSQLIFIGITNSQSVIFISEKSNPNFGCLLISNFDSNQLSFIEKEGIENCIKLFPQENWYNTNGDLPTMMGKFISIENGYIFQPRFPFREEKGYIVEFSLFDHFYEKITIPSYIDSPTTYATNIYPSTEKWPANILKIYVHFSNPMGNGNIYGHIKIIDDKGKEIKKPFLENNPPLWDKNQQRLTLWFDPGRIKRNLIPNKKYGPPLAENKKYKLMISKNCRDASGNKLSTDFIKEFETTASDRLKPNPENWTINPPDVLTTQAVSLIFNEPMDRGTLESFIGVEDENNKLVSGKIEVENSEQVWKFIPDKKWQPGNYRINFSDKLEDLAGNNLHRLFDTSIETENKDTTHSNSLLFIIQSSP